MDVDLSFSFGNIIKIHILSLWQARRAKMHYLEAELSMVDKRHGGEFANEEENKTEGRKIMDKKLRKHVELVEKVMA